MSAPDSERAGSDTRTEPAVRRRTEALGFKRYELVEMKTSPEGVITRTARLEPPFEIPGPARVLFPDGLGYTETGRFDPTQKRWTYRMSPKVLADKVTTGGQFWVEPRGHDRVERICEIDVAVKVFGIGGFVESYIERLTKESYDKASAFTTRYLAEQRSRP